MPVPKQKKGRGAVHARRSANMKIHVCPNCGFYKDREVIVTE